ncbi:MAG: glycogen(starch) synthase [Arenicella sp.]|jgi:glycogen(starch) synthase
MLRIALFSYEYPPDTHDGGIGTYTHQAARMLTAMGHYVEVFCGSLTRNGKFDEENVIVNRVLCPNGHHDFMEAVLSTFEQRHYEVSFQVIESPEFKADALRVAERFPSLALVVKLHTPSYLIRQLTHQHSPWFVKPYNQFRNINQGKRLARVDFREKSITEKADLVISPSESLATIVATKWKIKKIETLAYPFSPPKQLLSQSFCEHNAKQIAFVGRLEIRKGILPLLEALPNLLGTNRNILFHFIGKESQSPIPKVSMKRYIELKLYRYRIQIRFHGQQPQERVFKILENVSICVFPSLWENYPNVCLEAMTAGKAVVASKNGGMSEMIQDGINGLLINPYNSREISDALLFLLQNPKRSAFFGTQARKRIIGIHNWETMGKLQVQYYQETIDRKTRKVR